MKNLTKLALTGALIFGLNSCGDKKYQDFANFVAQEGRIDSAGKSTLSFSKDNKKYNCGFYIESLGANRNIILIDIYDERFKEYFQDINLNGLNYYTFSLDGKELVNDFFFQSKENKDKYEMLIDSLPKWYAESKK